MNIKIALVSERDDFRLQIFRQRRAVILRDSEYLVTRITPGAFFLFFAGIKETQRSRRSSRLRADLQR